MDFYGGLFVAAMLYLWECRQADVDASDAVLIMTPPPELYRIHGDSGPTHRI